MSNLRKKRNIVKEINKDLDDSFVEDYNIYLNQRSKSIDIAGNSANLLSKILNPENLLNTKNVLFRHNYKSFKNLSKFHPHEKTGNTPEKTNKKLSSLLSLKSRSKRSLVPKMFDDMIFHKGGTKLLQDTKQDESYDFAYYTKFYTYEMINASIGLLSIVLITIFFEATYSPDGNDDIFPYNFLLLFLNLLSVLLILSICFYYYEQHYLKILKNQVSKKKSFFHTKMFKREIIEILWNIVQPSPWFMGLKYSIKPSFKDGIVLHRSINSVLSLFVLFRVYYIDRFWVFQSSFMIHDNNSICRKYDFKVNIKFALIALIKTKPFHVYFMFVVTMLFVFQYAIKVFESSISVIYEDSFQLVNTFHVIWYCMITVFTVGYGDIFARTDGGRLFVTLLSVIGSFLISLFLMSMTNFWIKSPVEIKQYDWLTRIELNQIKVKKAAKVAKVFTQLIKKTNNVKDEIRELKASTRNLIKTTKNFNESDISIEHHNNDLNSFAFNNVSFSWRYFDGEYKKFLSDDIKRLEKMRGLLESVKTIENKLTDKGREKDELSQLIV